MATEGVQRGLIGPREVPRLWERHILNCAVIAERIHHRATVADVGSGAGLPGLVLAIARADIHVTLIEPLSRRTVFLEAVIEELNVNATVIRSKADAVVERFDVVTARAVAPLATLLEWTVPLLKPDGVILALKGQSAAEEIQAAEKTWKRLKTKPPIITHYGDEPPLTTVVEVTLG